MKWIKEMDNYNFLGIYDVMLDIKTEMNISPDRIIIPLLQNMMKFTQLFPINSIGTRDKYCEIRWKATEFLKKKGIIKDFELIKGFHRWESKLEIKLEKEIFEDALNKMKVEYKKRIARGAMTGIRNPKAHENITIDSRRAIHFLFLASLLMFKIDEKSD